MLSSWRRWVAHLVMVLEQTTLESTACIRSAREHHVDRHGERQGHAKVCAAWAAGRDPHEDLCAVMCEETQARLAALWRAYAQPRCGGAAVEHRGRSAVEDDTADWRWAATECWSRAKERVAPQEAEYVLVLDIGGRGLESGDEHQIGMRVTMHIEQSDHARQDERCGHNEPNGEQGACSGLGVCRVHGAEGYHREEEQCTPANSGTSWRNKKTGRPIHPKSDGCPVFLTDMRQAARPVLQQGDGGDAVGGSSEASKGMEMVHSHASRRKLAARLQLQVGQLRRCTRRRQRL
jgi:hypothetical protein